MDEDAEIVTYPTLPLLATRRRRRGRTRRKRRNPFSIKYNKENGYFLSHSGRNKAVAVCVARLLERRGGDFWLDVLHCKQKTADFIYPAIDRCNCFVVFASKHQERSKWCQRELGHAEGIDKDIVALNLERPQDGRDRFLGEYSGTWLQEESPVVAHEISEFFEKFVEYPLSHEEKRDLGEWLENFGTMNRKVTYEDISDFVNGRSTEFLFPRAPGAPPEQDGLEPTQAATDDEMAGLVDAATANSGGPFSLYESDDDEDEEIVIEVVKDERDGNSSASSDPGCAPPSWKCLVLALHSVLVVILIVLMIYLQFLLLNKEKRPLGTSSSSSALGSDAIAPTQFASDIPSPRPSSSPSLRFLKPSSSPRASEMPTVVPTAPPIPQYNITVQTQTFLNVTAQTQTYGSSLGDGTEKEVAEPFAKRIAEGETKHFPSSGIVSCMSLALHKVEQDQSGGGEEASISLAIVVEFSVLWSDWYCRWTFDFDPVVLEASSYTEWVVGETCHGYIPFPFPATLNVDARVMIGRII